MLTVLTSIVRGLLMFIAALASWAVYILMFEFLGHAIRCCPP